MPLASVAIIGISVTCCDIFSAELLTKWRSCSTAFLKAMDVYLSQEVSSLHLLGRESLQRRDPAAAARFLEQALERQPGMHPIMFDLGQAYAALGRFDDARAQFEKSVAWPGKEIQAYFALGYTLGELGDWPAAARAMLSVLRLAPHHVSALGSLSECAYRLARSGVKAPQVANQRNAAPLEGKISIIVCSIDPAKLLRLRSNLADLLGGEEWELIHISDARSLSEGYNRGVRLSRGDLLVFCHDDIEIFTKDLASRLRTHLGEFDLIGVAGSTLATGPSWSWSGAPYIFSSIAYPGSDHGTMMLATCGVSGPVISGAQLLDGVFMAARRDLLQELPFDEGVFDGFHFYDLDFSYRAWLFGAKTAVCRDITMCHQSRGNYNADYRRYAERFRQKFPDAFSASASPQPRFAEIVIAEREHLQPTIEWLNCLLNERAKE